MNGKFAKCWQLVASAIRLMLGLQLNWEVPGSKRPFKDQECARRLVWQLFNFDRVFAEGFEAYICCREDNMKIRLPCPEDAFNANKEVPVEHLNDRPIKSSGPPGLHGYQIKVVNIRHHVLTMSKKFASGPAYLQRERWEPSKVMEDVRKLQLELSRFSSSLPDPMKLTDQNIMQWIPSKERQVFVLIHGLLCTAHIDLYRFSLPGIRERGTPDLLKKLPHDFIVKSQKQAIAHAITLARFWETVHGQMKVLHRDRIVLVGDYNIAPLIQQCAKVLMTAKQHKLYRDLTSHSTAPLWRNELADGASIRRLIDSCLQVLQPWSKVIPSAKSRYDELVKSVEEFDRTSRYEEETTLKLASSDPSSIMRLPGPHYILENAYMAQAQRDQMNTPPAVPPAVLARVFGAALQQANYTHDPYTGLDAPEDDWQSEYCPRAYQDIGLGSKETREWRKAPRPLRLLHPGLATPCQRRDVVLDDAPGNEEEAYGFGICKRDEPAW
ncbi:unnamed protein product [Parascedosporium putredinis]|uniref:Xylanolytic transcriptional activator regulatory domain-containing protein n=1 Tax=Parascedosporium putredinis TaxID=1442378 RepID=A0A9P1MEC8_9PEZI|nr:unnamed protein product [Parascedosporium putredinis]CAI8002388.1 unnamed protein product [Parascedosporium putredinis]